MWCYDDDKICDKKMVDRSYLRERCMDLVSFESPQEYRHFATMMYYGEHLSDWINSNFESGNSFNEFVKYFKMITEIC